MMTNYGNRVTQGQFSYLPDLTDEQITAQIKYAIDQKWPVNIEYTDDPHPRNTYWEMYGMPMLFSIKWLDRMRKTLVSGTASIAPVAPRAHAT